MKSPKKYEDKTHNFFRTNGPTETQEELAKENKLIKDAKKEVKTLVKTSKDNVEEMTRTNARKCHKAGEPNYEDGARNSKFQQGG